MTPTEVAAKLRVFNDWRRGELDDLSMPDPREIGEAIDAAVEMIDRLEEAESDALEQARLNGMGSEREAALIARLEAAEKERDALRFEIKVREAQRKRIEGERHNANVALAGWVLEAERLRAKIEQMERQEPIAKVRIHKAGGNAGLAWSVAPLNDFDSPPLMRDGDRLYALPGAQPAPSFADAYQGAMEEVAIWKKRALEAEELNRKFIAEINGPTYMGEPAPSVPDGVAEALQRLIENGAVLGPASSEDALLVARYRQRLLACAPSVPDGWTLAPIEPTFEMLVAGEDMLVPTYTDTPVSVPFDVYRAMLAAAPEAKP